MFTDIHQGWGLPQKQRQGCRDLHVWISAWYLQALPPTHCKKSGSLQIRNGGQVFGLQRLWCPHVSHGCETCTWLVIKKSCIQYTPSFATFISPHTPPAAFLFIDLHCPWPPFWVFACVKCNRTFFVIYCHEAFSFCLFNVSVHSYYSLLWYQNSSTLVAMLP